MAALLCLDQPTRLPQGPVWSSCSAINGSRKSFPRLQVNREPTIRIGRAVSREDRGVSHVRYETLRDITALVTFPCCCGFSTRKLRPLPLRGNLALEIAMILGGQDRQKRRLHYHQATDSGLRICFDFFFFLQGASRETMACGAQLEIQAKSQTIEYKSRMLWCIVS